MFQSSEMRPQCARDPSDPLSALPPSDHHAVTLRKPMHVFGSLSPPHHGWYTTLLCDRLYVGGHGGSGQCVEPFVAHEACAAAPPSAASAARARGRGGIAKRAAVAF